MTVGFIRIITTSIYLICGYTSNKCYAQQADLQSLQIVRYSSTFCQVYSGQSKISEFKLSPDDKKWGEGFFSYAIEGLLNDSTIIASELYNSMSQQFSNVVLLDISGKVLKHITRSGKNEFSNLFRVNKQGNKAVYVKNILHGREYYKNEGDFLRSRFTPQQSIILRDLNSGEEFKLLNFMRGGVIFDSTPWAPIGDQLVYTVRCAPSIKIPNQNTIEDTCVNGSYVYDLKQMKNINFFPNSTYAIWSSNNDIIAYITKKGIWLYNCETKKHTLCVENRENFKVEHVRWVPNSQYLYVQYKENNKFRQTMYNITQNNLAIPIKLNLSDEYFSWREKSK